MRLITKMTAFFMALVLAAPLVTVSAENEAGAVFALDFKKIVDDTDVFSFARSESADLSGIHFFEEYIEGGRNINSNDNCDGLSLDEENVDFYFIERNRKELCVEGHTDKRNLIVFEAPVPGRYLYNLELHPWYYPDRARVDIIVGSEKDGYKTVKTHKYVSTTASLRTGSIDVGAGENVYFSFYGEDDYVPFAITRLDLKLLRVDENAITGSEQKDGEGDKTTAVITTVTVALIASGCACAFVSTLVINKKRKHK